MAKKSVAIAKSIGESYVTLHETDEDPRNPGPGRISIFRGRGSVHMSYGEMLEIMQFVEDNVEICEQELKYERERATSVNRSFLRAAQ